MTLSTELDRMGIYNEELSSIKSQGHSINNAYSHQAWKEDDLPPGSSQNKIIQTFEYLVTWGHHRNSYSIKPCRVATYNKELPLIKSQDPLIPVLFQGHLPN